MADIRNRPFRLPPGIVPEKLASAVFDCPTCTARSAVKWFDKMEFPQQPIAPYAGGGHWVPAGIPIACESSKCAGKQFHVPIPQRPALSTWDLYGDEASRFVARPLEKHAAEPLYFFCITLVGLHNSRHDNVRRQIAKLKRHIAPDRNPDDWCHHFKDIWGSDGRTGEFKLPNKDAKVEYAKAFAKVLRQARPELATFNISGVIRVTDPKQRAELIRAHNQELFSISLLTSLEQFRSRELGVRWVFDNIKDATDGSRTEGWAEEVFLGLQYTRLFSWLSAGTTVLPPTFVKPGSHYLLEVADFVSYCVARDFEKSVQGMRNELPSSLLGTGFYQGILADGSIGFKWARGIPLEEFFGIPAWSPVRSGKPL